MNQQSEKQKEFRPTEPMNRNVANECNAVSPRNKRNRSDQFVDLHRGIPETSHLHDPSHSSHHLPHSSKNQKKKTTMNKFGPTPHTYFRKDSTSTTKSCERGTTKCSHIAGLNERQFVTYDQLCEKTAEELFVSREQFSARIPTSAM